MSQLTIMCGGSRSMIPIDNPTIKPPNLHSHYLPSHACATRYNITMEKEDTEKNTVSTLHWIAVILPRRQHPVCFYFIFLLLCIYYYFS